MTATNSGAFQAKRIATGRLWWSSLIAAFGSAIANSLVYIIAASAGWIPHTVLIPGQNQPITLFPVIMNSIIPAFAAVILLALLNRFTHRPIRLFCIIALVVLLLSFAYPLILPEAPLAMVVTLDLMHVLAAAITIGVLTTVPVKQ